MPEAVADDTFEFEPEGEAPLQSQELHDRLAAARGHFLFSIVADNPKNRRVAREAPKVTEDAIAVCQVHVASMHRGRTELHV